MTVIPQFVRRLPYLLYALAAVLAVWRIYNDWFAAAVALQYADAGSSEVLLAKSTAFYWGVTEAIYGVGSAAMLQVLIAIFDRLERK